MNPQEVKQRYNTTVGDRYQGRYEQARWFSGPVAAEGHRTTKIAIERWVLPRAQALRHYLEVGPGPGTWTKFFYALRGDQAEYDLVDISAAMLDSAKRELGDHRGISFHEADFMEFAVGKDYDFFFSSRAVEYIPDKEAFMHKVAGLLQPGGQAAIITKTPKTFINRLLGRRVSDFHAGQIEPEHLRALAQKSGFSNCQIYPVTFSFPVLKSALANRILFFVFGGRPLFWLSKFVSESYCLVCQRT